MDVVYGLKVTPVKNHYFTNEQITVKSITKWN